jgi:hypothetical protein
MALVGPLVGHFAPLVASCPTGSQLTGFECLRRKMAGITSLRLGCQFANTTPVCIRNVAQMRQWSFVESAASRWAQMLLGPDPGLKAAHGFGDVVG